MGAEGEELDYVTLKSKSFEEDSEWVLRDGLDRNYLILP